MKPAILAVLLVSAILAVEGHDPTVRLCGSQLAEALNIVCMHKDTHFTESPSYHDLYENHLKPLVGTRGDAHPTRRPSLVEQCCVKECRLVDLEDYCP